MRPWYLPVLIVSMMLAALVACPTFILTGTTPRSSAANVQLSPSWPQVVARSVFWKIKYLSKVLQAIFTDICECYLRLNWEFHLTIPLHILIHIVSLINFCVSCVTDEAPQRTTARTDTSGRLPNAHKRLLIY